MSFVLTSSITHRACLLQIYRAQLYVLTFRFDFHTTFRCSRDKHVRIPHAVSWYQIHHRLRFCCDSFFICIFLRSFRHHFKTIAGTEMADVEQTQKMIPFITCEISLCQYVCELVVVSTYLIWFLGSKFILNNPFRVSLWVLETCLMVGLLPFMIILITASLSSKIYNKASWRKESPFEDINKINTVCHSMRFLSYWKFVRCCAN